MTSDAWTKFTALWVMHATGAGLTGAGLEEYQYDTSPFPSPFLSLPFLSLFFPSPSPRSRPLKSS